MAPVIYGRMPASVADRDRAIRTLQESFTEGRLTRAELDQRLGQALRSRDFRELLALTADLPSADPFARLPAHRTTPRRIDRRYPTLGTMLGILASVTFMAIGLRTGNWLMVGMSAILMVPSLARAAYLRRNASADRRR
jgi:hypothetical protein